MTNPNSVRPVNGITCETLTSSGSVGESTTMSLGSTGFTLTPGTMTSNFELLSKFYAGVSVSMWNSEVGENTTWVVDVPVVNPIQPNGYVYLYIPYLTTTYARYGINQTCKLQFQRIIDMHEAAVNTSSTIQCEWNGVISNF